MASANTKKQANRDSAAPLGATAISPVQPKRTRRDEVRSRLERWALDPLISSPDRVSNAALPSEAKLLSIDKLEGTDVAKLVSSFGTWLPLERADLIGGKVDAPLSDFLMRWCKEEIAVALVLDHHGGTVIMPKGFATLSFYENVNGNGPTVEIGRLLVEPESRGQNIGHVLISNLASLVLSIDRKAQIVLRVVRGNKSATDLVADIANLREVPDHSPYVVKATQGRDTKNEFRWFIWEDLKFASGESFSETLASIRRQRKLSQQLLAQRARLTREAINTLENQRSRAVSPSVEAVSRLISGLGGTDPLSTIDITRLLYSAVSRPLPTDIAFSENVRTEATDETFAESRWILSDRFLEATDADELRRSALALTMGYQRVYMFPSDYMNRPNVGLPLMRRIREEVKNIAGSKENVERALAKLRAFTAPPALCRLRIVVFGAVDKSGQQTAPQAVSMTTTGLMRLELSAAQGAAIVQDLIDSIGTSLLNSKPPTTKEDLQDGFAAISIDT